MIDEHFAKGLYHDSHFGIPAAKLLPGEYYVTAKNMMLVTVLGSCVAACIRDSQFGLGGMNHFMLPESVHEPDNPLSSSARYGTYAMEVLINGLLKLGARRDKLEAKVFGGGNVLRGMSATHVGQRNADFVLAYLKAEKIPVLAQDMVDIYPRKIYYFPEDGRVMVKRLRVADQSSLVKVESDYSRHIRRNARAGEVELFD